MSDERTQIQLEAMGRALDRLAEVLERPNPDEIVMDATIQRFEFTFEQTQRTLRRCLSVEGVTARSPREVFQQAFSLHWVSDEQLWADMIDDRNATSHVYNENMARRIYRRVQRYYPHLRQLHAFLMGRFGQ